MSENSKKVRLGKKAESFFDPTTRLQVLKGQVVTLERKHLKSKRVKSALAGGHLEYTDNSANSDGNEYSPMDAKPGEYDSKGAKIGSKSTSKKEENDEEVVHGIEVSEEKEYTEDDLKQKSVFKHTLVAIALVKGSEEAEEDLKKWNKSDLVDEILELQEGEEDEEDEEDEEEEGNE